MDYTNFTKVELSCSHCGQRNPDPQLERRTMRHIQDIRTRLAESMPMTSGYRCPEHPIEAKKLKPGEHSRSANDIGCDSSKGFRILNEAIALPYLKLIDALLAERDMNGIITPDALDRHLFNAGWDGRRLQPIFTGIGISQKKGGPRFIHLDTRTTMPFVWSY